MTMRRQALCSSALLATSLLLSLILVFFFTLPSILVRAEPVSSGTGGALGEADRDRALMQNPSGAGLSNSLMPSAPPQLAFDGGAVAATESAPADIDAASPVPDPAPRPDTLTAVPTGPDVGQADQTYPLLPLTVVPKPDASPLAALKVLHDTNQRIAILALVLALLSAVTFILWRYHRRDYASPRRIGRRI